MKPAALLLSAVFAALASAAAHGGGSGGSTSHTTTKTKTTKSSGPKGLGGVIFLDGPCTTNDECLGGKKGRCGKADEYFNVLPDGDRQGDRASFACAYAKVFTGQCGYAERKQCACYPPNDAACTYVNDCEGLEIVGSGVPNAIVDDEGLALCRCPSTLADARAGFAKGPPPDDECSEPYKQPGGLDPPAKAGQGGLRGQGG